MSYWIGLSESNQLRYEDEFKKPPVTDASHNPFKIAKCRACDQRVVMKLIHDPLSNSSFWVYAGKCPNGHWNQDLPSVPDDVRIPPRCPDCGAFMQYKTSVVFSLRACNIAHEERKG